jgi:hypothetical protein
MTRPGGVYGVSRFKVHTCPHPNQHRIPLHPFGLSAWAIDQSRGRCDLTRICSWVEFDSRSLQVKDLSKDDNSAGSWWIVGTCVITHLWCSRGYHHPLSSMYNPFQSFHSQPSNCSTMNPSWHRLQSSLLVTSRLFAVAQANDVGLFEHSVPSKSTGFSSSSLFKGP